MQIKKTEFVARTPALKEIMESLGRKKMILHENTEMQEGTKSKGRAWRGMLAVLYSNNVFLVESKIHVQLK